MEKELTEKELCDAYLTAREKGKAAYNTYLKADAAALVAEDAYTNFLNKEGNE